MKPRSVQRRIQVLWVIATTAVFATGCRPTQPNYLYEDGDLSHYVDTATDIEYPDACTESLADVTQASEPLTLENPKPREMWDLSLQEAVQTSLANAKVMRSLGGRFLSQGQNRPQVGEPPDAILSSPDNVVSVYDPAIIESTPFGGVESALAAFDAQWTTNFFYSKNDRQQNVRPNGVIGSFFRPVFDQQTSTFNTTISKVTASGTSFNVQNNTVFDTNNNPTRLVAGDFNVNYQFGFNAPLLAGAGAQFNRIAGPYSPFVGGPLNTLQFDGVMLARINTDISLADFERGVRNLVYDTENAYWELYVAYRSLEAAKTGRASALQTWRKVHALYKEGGKGGDAAAEAQSREQYFFFRTSVQTALNDLYRAENRLRYIMGIAVADGRLIRPSDEVTTAHVQFNWSDIQLEGLARSVELRRQKWRIKERELELIAARNLFQPRLDATGYYRFLGLGDHLLDTTRSPAVNGIQGISAYQSLTSGDFQEWQLGLQMQVPIGFRRELAQIRHYELQLSRERARLQDQELEVSHELGDAVRNIEGNYALSQSNFNRRVAAEKQVEAVAAAVEADTATLDLLLDAQRRRADAEIAYYRSLVDYNRGIAQVHYRKGSLLEYNGVYLAEGPWPDKAKFDAERLARQRDASYYLDYGFTRPRVISQGPYRQNAKDILPVSGGQQSMQPAPLEASEDAEQIMPSSPVMQGAKASGDRIMGSGKATPKKGGEVDDRTASLDEAPAITRTAQARRESSELAVKPLAKRKRSRATGAESQAMSSSNNRDLGLRKTSPPRGRLTLGDAKAEANTTEGVLPNALAVESPLGLDRAAAGLETTPANVDKAVRPATHHEWKSRGQHEPDANQSTGAASGSSAGWRGTRS